MKEDKICIGFGEHEGKCENKVDKKINPVWCPRCDKIRVNKISNSLTRMLDSFNNDKG